jgi:2',3'-cyclic-nucleotide 2'-phosphodiesterase (5'-nucleotidase family)
VIQKARETGGAVLVLDAGDLLFYTNVDHFLPSAEKKEALLDAQLIVEAFNVMGCDAVGIGEDELRLGVKGFTTVKEKAKFPFISANVVLKNGQQLSIPSMVKDTGGVRWGIFSLMSADPSFPSRSRKWKVLDPVSTGKQTIEALRAKVDIIVLLAAMPLDELRDLLPQLPGVAIAVAGDNPSGLIRPLRIGQTIVVCSPGYGNSVGMLHLSFQDPQAPFADEAGITQLETELVVIDKKMREGASGSLKEKKKEMEAELQELIKGNTYRNEFIMLSSQFQEDQGVQKLIDDSRAKHQEMNKGCSER